MAQGRSTEIISVIKWIRASMSAENTLSDSVTGARKLTVLRELVT